MASVWTAGSFETLAFLGEDKTPRKMEVAGWLNDIWGLDFRVWEDDDCDPVPGWHLTHVPTGYSAFGILTGLTVAKSIATEIARMGDWNFQNPEQAKALGPVAAAVMKRFGDNIVRGRATWGPHHGERDAFLAAQNPTGAA